MPDIATAEEIIEESRAGRMVILVDHEDRENEGDLVIPAEMADADAVNFMARYGRGLICLAMTAEHLDKLGLPMMAKSNSSRHETAFTVSIEAREGVTTGISAADRAQTIKVAINPQSAPQDIASPGHVFPLRARRGGVLVRAGHTEAAVDIARLAGLKPAGVICEIMKEDGTMARLPDLMEFAKEHNLKIGTISDLIAYRRQYDVLVTEQGQRPLASQFGGDWQMRAFEDEITGAEHMVLTKGDFADGEPVLVRMHATNPFDDLIAEKGGKWGELQRAMDIIGDEGRGVVVIFRNLGTKLGLGEADAPSEKIRHYGVGAQILRDLGIRKLELLTNSGMPKVVGLEAYGLTITGTRKIEV